ncbi:MAG: exodeoxyribonuclease V subunit gamma [Melioribacteraceae bacterium]|nr:exodeoxyribonuclease V subunit gamma [Melioribacteraceae bacterium]
MILTNTSDKSVNIDNKIDDLILHKNIDKMLLIVPTNRRIRGLKKRIIDNTPDKCISKIYLHTLTTFSSAILNRQFNFGEMSESTAAILLKKCSEEIEMKYFRNYEKGFPAGTLNRIHNVIMKYKENGITPEKLFEESRNIEGSEKLKAEDIAAVYLKYQSLVKLTAERELGDIYSEINSMTRGEFAENFIKLFPEVKFIILIGFHQFTILEVEIVKMLSNLAGISFYIGLDYFNYNQQVFASVRKTVEELKRVGLNEAYDLSIDTHSPFINYVRQNLFRIKPEVTPPEFGMNLNIIRAFDRGKEVELIAKEIKKTLISEKVQPSQICVLFNLIENYSDLIRYVFNKYGLPFNLTDRYKLSDSYPVSAIINFLEIAENDFYYKNIARAMQNNFVNKYDIDVNNLIRMGSLIKVVKGYSNWIDGLDKAIKFIDDSDTEVLNKTDKNRIEKAKSDITKIYKLIAPFNKKMTIDEFLSHLQKLIIRLDTPSILINNPSMHDEKNIKAFSVFIETTEEIFALLKMHYGNDVKYSLGFFLDNIRTACRSGRFNIKEKTDYGILVTTPAEIRGLRFKYVFLGGMIDGDFPTKFAPEIFFTENYSKKETEHINEERYLFYQSLNSGIDGIWFSLPAAADSKEFTESSFLRDLRKLINIPESDENDYKEYMFAASELQKNFFNTDKNSLPDLNDSLLSKRELERRIKIDLIRREKPSEESQYNGFIFDCTDKDMRAEALDFGRRLKNKEFSASELELYAKCPFRYFIERVLRIEVSEEPSEEIEAIETGSILHSILYEFYSEVRNNGIVLYNCDEQTFRKYTEMIFSIAEKHLSQSFIKSPVTFYDIEKLLGLTGDKRQSILFKFVEYERNFETSFLPEFFEVSFGKIYQKHVDSKLHQREPVEVGSIKLKGKIDRIEIDEASRKFNITDYKLGYTVPAASELERGVSLQLPLYLMCAEKLLGIHLKNNYKPNLMYIFSLKYQHDKFGKFNIKKGRSSSFDPEKFNNELIEIVKEHLNSYASRIAGGKFHLSSHDDREKLICRYCDFRALCRINDTL